MKTHRPYPMAFITPKGERACRAGHPWVYDAEVERIVEAGDPKEAARTWKESIESGGITPENGALVDVLSRKGAYLGTGIFSQQSKIRIRLLSTNANDAFDSAFWERKIRWAWNHRRAVMGNDVSACRMIFSEADGFCGLVVDRFNDVLVTQTLAYGMERLKPVVFPLLVKVLAEDGVVIRGIYERNDVSTRKLEGLQESCGWFPLENDFAGLGAQPALSAVPAPLAPSDEAAAAFGPTTTEIIENGVRYHVDFENGQKTGFFLDQKYNRLAIQRLCKNAKVLDCFTHTGSFALNAGIAGAQSVLGVDASETAVNQARRNAELNGLDGTVKFLCEDVFELLPELEEKGEKFDVVILDPPAFTKSRSSVKNAVKGYREINLRAMRLVKDGGFLATCSCSHFMTYELFTQTIGQAAKNVHKRLRQVEYRTQAPDHPILWSADESYYLKFYIFQVCNDR